MSDINSSTAVHPIADLGMSARAYEQCTSIRTNVYFTVYIYFMLLYYLLPDCGGVVSNSAGQIRSPPQNVPYDCAWHIITQPGNQIKVSYVADSFKCSRFISLLNNLETYTFHIIAD